MVQEVRNIVLSLEEIRQAFEDYQRLVPESLPQGTVMECKVSNDSVVVFMKAANDPAPPYSEVTRKGIDVLKTLIHYCIANKIKLPRQGKKSVFFKPNKIILQIELTLTLTDLAPASPAEDNTMVALDIPDVSPREVWAAIQR